MEQEEALKPKDKACTEARRHIGENDTVAVAAEGKENGFVLEPPEDETG